MKIQLAFVFILLASFSFCYQEVHDEKSLFTFYEQNSFKPILHTYYNHHFKNSAQFKQFQSILDELYYDHGDYIQILFTDCEKDKELKLKTCQSMNKTKDNRRIAGTFPSSEFKRLGNKIVQSPPFNQMLQNTRDVYTYKQLKDFIIPLMPNFYKQLNNEEEYLDFLNPRYSPKLIVFIRDDEQIPLVLRQIGITFFLKIDLAYVTDLTQDITSQFKIKEYPSFAIVKYNFNQTKHEYFYYEDQVNDQNYKKIKQFVGKYALKENRNDLVFHKIQMRPQSQIITVETQGELEQQKQRAQGWLIIMSSDGRIPQKLANYHRKYGQYFTYINYVNGPADQFSLYSPTQNITAPILTQTLAFNTMNAEDFSSNMTFWLHRGAVILGVRQQYGYVCGISQKTFFRGTVKCFVIDKDQQEKLKQQIMKIDYKVGFIVKLQQKTKGGKKQPGGVRIMDDNYQTIYKDLDYATRFLMRNNLDQYIENPISEVPKDTTVLQACFHPYKKCLFLITNLEKKDRTFQEYMKELAFDYMDSYFLYEVDMDSNPELVKAVGGIRDKRADIVVYHPRARQFTKLNKKITKSLIAQFLKANLKNDKRLKMQKIQDFGDIVIKRRSKDGNSKTDEEL